MSDTSFQLRLDGFLRALASRCRTCLQRGGSRCPECYSTGAKILADELRQYRIVSVYAKGMQSRDPELTDTEAEILAIVKFRRRVRGSNIQLDHRVTTREKREALHHLVATGRLVSEREIQSGKGVNYYSLPAATRRPEDKNPNKNTQK